MASKHKKPLHEVARAAVLEAKDEQAVDQLIQDMRAMHGLFDEHPELSTEYGDFLEAMERAAREEAGHFECTVTSAVALDEVQARRLTEALANKFGGSVRLTANVDPSVIGGFSVTSGDWRFPGTVKEKLEALERHLIA